MSLVQSAFEEYLHRVELNPDRVRAAAVHYNAVKDVIESALPGSSVRRIGSFQRQTKIRPLDPEHDLDVDAIVLLGSFTHFLPAPNGVSGSQALQRVKAALSSHERYRLLHPESDAPTVTLEYPSDGFVIELVPAYEDRTGQHVRAAGGPLCYWVVGSDGGWMPADYDYDAAMITALNQHPDVQGALVPVIKLAKAYMREVASGLKSFHIEVLVANALPGVLADWNVRKMKWEYQHAFTALLRVLVETVAVPAQLPGSFSPAVGPNIALPQLGALVRFLENRAGEAYRLCFEVEEADAVEGWRRFFGEPFPALSAVA